MASFGETLKRERELREISLRQIAEATKISIRYLEALEANQFDVLPGGLFNKGFIRAYSRFIGIDGEAMVNSYLQAVGPQPPGTGISIVRDAAAMHRPSAVPQRRAGPRSGDSSAERTPKPAITFAPATPRPAGDGSTTPSGATAPGGSAADDAAAASAASPAGPVAAPGASTVTGSVSPAVASGRAASAPGSVPAPAASAMTGSAGPARAAAQATKHADAKRAAWAAIDTIDKADRPRPPSSRALFWILSVVAAAGVLFLLLSILRPAPPAASLPGESPETETGAPIEPTEGAEPAPQDAAQPPEGSSALLPDMSQPSHITLGALTSGATAGTPAADMTAAGIPLAAPGPTTAPLAPTAANPTAAHQTAGYPSAGPLSAAALSTARPAATPTPRPRPEPTPRPERDPVPPPPAGLSSGPGERGSNPLLQDDAGPMNVDLLVSERTFVQIVCDGRVVVNRLMEAGETEEARCSSVVRISATDAGAARVTVNGSPCLPLGDPGTKAYGYTIRVDDFARICARNQRGSRGRR